MAKSAMILVVNNHRLTVTSGSESKIDFSASAEISWGNDKAAHEQLQKLVPASRRQQRNISLVLPRNMFFSKQIRLPSVDEKEIRKMVFLQIGQHLPYPVEQAAWDFIICQKVGLASDILLLSIQLENVMRYLRPLVLSGISPTHVTISSCLWESVSSFSGISAQKVIFAFDDTSSEFVFCSAENNFYSSRGIVYGEKDFGTETAKQFLNQVRLTFEAHRKNFPQSAVSTGFYTKVLSDDFIDALSHSSGIAWKQLPLPAHLTPEMALIRREAGRTCNFLPTEFKTRNLAEADRTKVLTMAVLIAGVMISATLAVGAPVLKKQIYLRQLDGELSRAKVPFSKSQKERELLTAVTQSLNQRISPLKLVEEIYRCTPQGVTFIRVQVSAMNNLELEGNAPVSTTVNDLQERMIASNLFREVRLEHATRRGGATGENVRFLISAKLQN